MSFDLRTRLLPAKRAAASAAAAAATKPPAAWLMAWGTVVLVSSALLFLMPRHLRFFDTPWGLATAAAAVGFLARRRLADGLALALPPLAGRWVDPELGAQTLLVPCLVIHLATFRPRLAAVTGSVLVAVLLASVRLKERFGGSPMTWQDVRYFFGRFADNVGVLATQPTLLACAGLVVVAAILACAAAWRWDAPPPRVRGTAPVAAAGLAALLAAHGAGQLAQAVATLRTSGAWFVAAGLAEQPVLGFFATVSLLPRWDVPAVDTAPFREASRGRMSTAAGSLPADIVVFLQESQFNPATLDGCRPALCRLEAFGARAGTVAYGPLQVHVFGGGTWLSEFALQTGVPHEAFGPAGEFASFSIAPGVRRSFARSLKAAGYRTVALYPTRGGMMNGRQAYAGYGFDEFLDASQLDLPGEWDTPDELVHQAARRVLERERAHGQPVFMFVQTIFNHAEHGVRLERVPPALLDEAGAEFASRDEAASVADYVWRSRAFEHEMALTRQAVLGTSRPAVLAWFGDHQPPFANAVSLRQRVRSLPTRTGTVPARFQTWYEVAGNRPPAAAASAPAALDLALLPGLLAQAAGAPLDDWLAANVQARLACDGLLEECRSPGTRAAYLSYLEHDLGEFELP